MQGVGTKMGTVERLDQPGIEATKRLADVLIFLQHQDDARLAAVDLPTTPVNY